MPFKRRPRFLFQNQGGRITELVCDPRPFVRAWMEDGRPLWAPCLAWSPGPQELQVTGDGEYTTLFGANWLAEICLDGRWILYQRVDKDTLEQVLWDVEPPIVDGSARHPTLCFDQTARPVIAWEEIAGIRLREYNEVGGSYQFIGPFSGCDPVLINDATINYHIPGSDVVLFYLSEDRTKLMYRVQNENFLIEHEHHDFERQVILDAQDVGSWRLQLKFSDEFGQIIGPSGNGFTAVVSDVYPIYLREEMSSTIHSLLDGSYMPVIISYSDEDAMEGFIGILENGSMVQVTIYRTSEDAMEGSISIFSTSLYESVIIERILDPDEMIGNIAIFENGDYIVAVIKRQPSIDEMVGSVGVLEDGSYVAA